MVTKKYNEKSGQKEYALVSRKSGRVLEWFGPTKPTKARYKAAEARVQYHKNKFNH
jgi:hypothetical protein